MMVDDSDFLRLCSAHVGQTIPGDVEVVRPGAGRVVIRSSFAPDMTGNITVSYCCDSVGKISWMD
jgi:hypothetical protein